LNPKLAYRCDRSGHTSEKKLIFFKYFSKKAKNLVIDYLSRHPKWVSRFRG